MLANKLGQSSMRDSEDRCLPDFRTQHRILHLGREIQLELRIVSQLSVTWIIKMKEHEEELIESLRMKQDI